MKILLPAILLLFPACGLDNSDFFTRDYDVGRTKQVTVGSVMISWTTGIKNNVYGTILKSFTRELSYSGIAQNVVQVNYREFSDGYARQPFYQDLKYDITHSKMITFQDIRIRVESANQESIVFTVLQGPRILEEYERKQKEQEPEQKLRVIENQ